MDSLIVSRHPAAIKFVAAQIAPKGVDMNPQYSILEDRVVLGQGYEQYSIPVIASATPSDVAEKRVYGNLPLHLACLAYEVVAVEFDGLPPRGQEYTLEDMIHAGAKLTAYYVQKVG